MTMTRRQLMTERDVAIARGDWRMMNQITRQIAELPRTDGVPTLTQADVDNYMTHKPNASVDLDPSAE